ncbi:Zn-ribbon domain-containing OB-fold protein [Piscinibacter sakaiensis]|uniref:Zn-ribbon domain-containing OB-fold protein n=1 Tax=Piscinibacter sakaiensis TaxID=1547922 RepID=UPI003AAB6806
MRLIDPREAHVKPLPTPDADSRDYWQGLKDGKLLLQHCAACGHVQFYQQAICRQCGSEELEHRAASGRGVVHSYSVVHRAPGPAFKQETPYAVLLVELVEGPRMISSLADADPTQVEFDMPVELVCEQVGEQVVLPRFRPVGGLTDGR